MTTIRIKPHIHKKLKEIAKQEGRSFSNFLLHCAATYTRERYNVDVLAEKYAKEKSKKK